MNRMRLVALLALVALAIYVQYIDHKKRAGIARVKAARLRFRKAERAAAASRADALAAARVVGVTHADP